VWTVARITATSFAMAEKHYGHLVMNAVRDWLNARTCSERFTPAV
jgi:hypothetical protein